MAPHGFPRSTHNSLVTTALVVGLMCEVWTLALGYAAYIGSRNAIREAVAKENLALGRSVSQEALAAVRKDGASSRHCLMLSIVETWFRLRPTYEDSYLCIVEQPGRVAAHTRRPDLVGADMRHLVLERRQGQPKRTVADLMERKTSWAGQVLNYRGDEQIAGYCYCRELDSLILVHVPVRQVDSAFRGSSTPWLISLAILAGVLLPSSLGLLFCSYYRADHSAQTILEAFGRSENRFRLICNLSPDGIIVLKGQCVDYANAEAARIAGLSHPGQLIGRGPFDFIATEDIPLAAELLAIVLTEESPPPTAEFRVRGADGVTRNVEFNSCRVDSPEGPTIHIVARDVSEMKRIAEQQQQLTDESAHMARVISIGEMVAGIAHEVNQPLGAIANYAAAAAEQLKDSERCNLRMVRESVEAIKTQAHRAASILRGIRSYVGRQETRKTPVRINEILQETEDFIASHARRKRATIRWELIDEDPSIHADRVQIQQVVVNLLHNAMDAMSDVTESDRVIVVQGRCDADHVEISVADRGPGMPPERMAQLIQPFRTTKRHGLGMGLVICDTIIEAHQGTIRALNPTEGGAVVRFRLPVAKEVVTNNGTNRIRSG